MRLNVKAFSLACGLIWALGLFVMTWWIIAFDGSSADPTLIGRVYRGYTVSPVGSVIGLVWAFPDGLIGGAIFAWLYNVIAACPRCAAGSAPPADSAQEKDAAG